MDQIDQYSTPTFDPDAPNQNELKLSQEEQELQNSILLYEEKKNEINKHDTHQILDQLNINFRTKMNLKNCLDNFQLINHQCQELLTIYQDEKSIVPSTQLIKLSVLGMMQINQIIESFYYPDQTLSNELQERIAILGKYAVKIKSKDEINEVSLNIVLEYLLSDLLKNLNLNCKSLLENDKKNDPKLLWREFKVLIAKLNSCVEIIPNCASLDKQDLFCFERNHPEWMEINQKVQFKALDTIDNLKKAYQKITDGILVANAMISKGQEFNNEFMKQAMQGFGAVYYSVMQQRAKSKAQEFIADAKKENFATAWNLGEQGLLKTLMPVIFPNIKFNKKIYIDRYFREITKPYILSQYQNNTINKINNDVGNNFIIPQQIPTIKELYTKSKLRSQVQIRVLCHEELEDFQEKNMFQNMVDKLTNKKIEFFEQLIIHIHGGGFVSMSSRSHQTYTRKWANSLKVPIFSIDYRKAPNDPYPAGLSDCWQAYMWILNFVQKYFNILPKRVVLVGDSAGGNLVAALTVQCIKAGVRIPDGIILAYPALYLNSQFFTPSNLISLDDGLLPHTFLRLCIESYIGDPLFNADIDPMISPSKASEEILSKFPPTRIVAGTNDPLHDESWRLAQKLIKLKKNLQMIIYEGLPHGFLSFDVPQGLKVSAQTVQDACELLAQLLFEDQQIHQQH